MVKNIIYLLMSALAGAIYAFGFPNFLGAGFFPLVLVAVLLLIISLNQLKQTRWRAGAILLFNLVFNLVGFYWITFTFKEFGGMDDISAQITALFLALVLNPFWWGYLLFLHWKEQLPGWQHFSFETQAFIQAGLLTALEAAIPQQFPVYLGHAWGHFHTQLQLVDVFGVHLYSFIGYWLVFALSGVVTKRQLAWSGLVGALILTLLDINWTMPAKESSRRSLDVRIVQANIGNLMKLESEAGNFGAISGVAERYKKLSVRNHVQTFDLIIWPETAYPYTLETGALKVGAEITPPLLTEIMASTGAEMLIGGYDVKPEARIGDTFETEYNTVFHFGRGGELKQYYHKQVLIPFGETMPFGPFNKWLSQKLPAVSFFAKGDTTAIFSTRNGIQFITPICYEILSSSLTASMLNAGNIDLIVNVTNDSWYGATAEPRQHLFLAKWRALEYRIPIIRSTNTGITSVIAPDGREGRQLLTNEEDVLDVRIDFPLKRHPTIRQQWGDWPLNGLLGLLAAIFSLAELLRILRAKGRASVTPL